MRQKKRFSIRESRSQCKSAAVSADSFAATRCAAPLKRAATDWYYHIGKGTRLLISLSFCRRGKKKERKWKEWSAPLSLSLPTSLFLLRFSISIVFPVRLSVPFSYPRYTTPSPHAFFFHEILASLFPSRAHPILVHEDFNLVWSRHRHVPHLPLDFLRKLREIPFPLITYIFPSLSSV